MSSREKKSLICPENRTSKHRLDVQDRGSVNGLQGVNLEPVPAYFQDAHLMQSDGIGPVRGTGGEHPVDGSGRAVTGPAPEQVTAGHMHPGQDHDFLSWHKAVQARYELLLHVNDTGGHVLPALSGALFRAGERGAHITYGLDLHGDSACSGVLTCIS